MGTRDPRVDAYIAKSAPFAQPILTHLRELVHKAADVDEAIKWGMPFFERNGPVCHIAAFKAHCAMGFWRSAELDGMPQSDDEREGMGHFGKFASLADLPPGKQISAWVKQTVKLNAAGPRKDAARRVAARKPPAEVPADLAKALRADKRAGTGFQGLTDAQRREYIEWITEAKTEATRAKRLETTLEWASEGKHRNWKYQAK